MNYLGCFCLEGTSNCLETRLKKLLLLFRGFLVEKKLALQHHSPVTKNVPSHNYLGNKHIF